MDGVYNFQLQDLAEYLCNRDWVINNTDTRIQDRDVYLCIRDRDVFTNLCIQDRDVLTNLCIRDWDADGTNHVQNIDESQNSDANIIVDLSYSLDMFSIFNIRSLRTIVLCTCDLMAILSDIATKMYSRCASFIPCREWWPPYVRQLDLITTFSCLTLYKTVSERCRQIKVYLARYLFRRHDFVAIRESPYHVLRRYTMIFILCSRFSTLIYVPHSSPQPFGSMLLTVCSKKVNRNDTGGGKIPVVSFKELQPYISSNKSFLPDMM